MRVSMRAKRSSASSARRYSSSRRSISIGSYSYLCVVLILILSCRYVVPMCLRCGSFRCRSSRFATKSIRPIRCCLSTGLQLGKSCLYRRTLPYYALHTYVRMYVCVCVCVCVCTLRRSPAHPRPDAVARTEARHNRPQGHQGAASAPSSRG